MKQAARASTTAPGEARGKPPGERGVIELRLQTVAQLFNSLDPTPFPQKDLDADAEEFIVSWAREFSHKQPLTLLVHLDEAPTHADPVKLIEDGVHAYFTHREEIARRHLRQLFSRGRWSLLIGLIFLAGCIGVADLATTFEARGITGLIRESLLIAGWVAMWRPMEIFLYDWWPMFVDRNIYRRLACIDVRVILRG